MTAGLRPLSLGLKHPNAPPRGSSDSSLASRCSNDSTTYPLPSDPRSSTPSHDHLLLRNGSTMSLPPQHHAPRPRNRKKKAPYRARLFFRIVSMLASGIAAGLMTDVVFNYLRSKHHTAKGVEFWPEDTWLTPSIAVLAIAALCCLMEFVWFVGSARRTVRMLEGRRWVWRCLVASVLCGCLLLSVAVYGSWARGTSGGERDTVWWVCEASKRKWEWDFDTAREGNGSIDLDWLCGELKAGEVTAYLALAAQVGVVATVVLEAIWGSKKGW